MSQRRVSCHYRLRIRIPVGPCKSVLDPDYAAVEYDWISVSVKKEEWSNFTQRLPDIPVVKHPALGPERACEKYLGIPEPKRKKQPSPERTDLHASISFVGTSYVGVAHRIVKLFDICIYQDIKVLHGSIIDLRPVKFYVNGRSGRQVLHEKVREPSGRDFVDGIHHYPVSVGKFKVHVHPCLVLQFGQVKLPYGQHYLPVPSVQLVPVYVDIIKVIIRPYGLELLVCPQERRVIPQPDIPHGLLVGLQFFRSDLIFRRQWDRPHAVQSESPPGIVKMVTKEWFFKFVFVRLYPVLLDKARYKRSGDPTQQQQDPDQHSRHLPHWPVKIHKQESSRRCSGSCQDTVGRQEDLYVCIARSKNHSCRRKKYLIPCKPVSGSPHDQQERSEKGHMEPCPQSGGQFCSVKRKGPRHKI